MLFAGSWHPQARAPDHDFDEAQLVGPDGRERSLLPAFFLGPAAQSAHPWRWPAPNWPDGTEPRPWYRWREVLAPC